ncbi:MAG: 2-hydroxyacid dehydrogenase [Ruminococcaceae bacterium]|nr:2-hydroxyacid dehydrogenase [Oscillospiraceae bacterium]
MKRIAFFDTKPYDKIWFDEYNNGRYEIVYFEGKLNRYTVGITAGFDGVCGFVNDDINADVINSLVENNVKILAMRSAGYSNVDLKAAKGRLPVVRVPAYSPYAVAEHAMGLLLTVNRKLARAVTRTRDFNFSIAGLMGVDLHGKTVGVIGTGTIGRVFIDICKGFGMKVIAYDPYPAQNIGVDYVPLTELFKQSDVISLHCPLTESSYHLLNKEAFELMKKGVFIVNTSRGALVDSDALLDALKSEKVRGAALDVYEEETDLFFEDMSGTIIKDDTLSLLISNPNVVLTSHQAFLTEEALEAIAKITLKNFDDFFAGNPLENEVKR